MNRLRQAEGNPLMNDQYKQDQGENYLHSDSDIVKQISQLLQSKNSSQRLQFAIESFFDALNYQGPQITLQINLLGERLRKYESKIYKWQKSNLWKKILTILSYIFMLTICISAKKAQVTQMWIQWVILSVICADFLVEVSNSVFIRKLQREIFQYKNIAKIIVIILLSFDQIIATYNNDDKLRIISVLRVVLPLFYDSSLRMKISSILSLYKDFLVFVLFYSVVIFFFALITIQLAQIPEEKKIDHLTENYRDIGQAMVLLYVMSSYDSYPDNQLQAVRSQPTIYGLFILFIFMNILVFSNVPTSFLYQQFKNHYSKSLLVQETKRRNSLVCTFIALSDYRYKLTKSRFLDFLFAIYSNKINSVDTITDVCFKINLNQSQWVDLSSFLQLCSAIQSNCQLLPHYLPYCIFWETIKKKINDKFDLSHLVYSKRFQIIVAVIVFVSIVNCLLAFYSGYQIFDIIDNRLFVFIFVLQISIKIIGLGFEIFLRHALNIFDFAIVFIMIVLELLKLEFIPYHSVALLNIFRFYRVPLIGKLIAQQKQTLNHNVFYLKSARLINQIILIFPVVFSFFPVYLLASYMLGVIGMWIYEEPALIEPKQSPYSKYHEFSNFETFINSQFVNIQILVQAGWSMILFDSSFRYGHRLMTTLYFICCHLIIVFVLSPLFKGVIWALYETLDKQSSRRIQKIEDKIFIQDEKEKERLFSADQDSMNKRDTKIRKDVEDQAGIYNFSQSVKQQSGYNNKDIEKEQIEKEQSQYAMSPSLIVQYFNRKCQILNESELQQKPSVDVILKSIRQILQIRNSKKERIIRKSILQTLQSQGLPKQYKRQKKQSQTHINKQEMLRKTFLRNLDPNSIKQFEQLHLLHNYSKHFQTQILAKLSTSLIARQSEIISAFSLLLSSSYISVVQFFSNLSVIENLLTNQILPKGSFFKFLFRLNKKGHSFRWFSVQVNKKKLLDPHFLKNGVWIWDDNLITDRVYYAEDIFLLEPQNRECDKDLIKEMKTFFQNIQSISSYADFCHTFLNYNPKNRHYDFYSYCKKLNTLKSELKVDSISVLVLQNVKRREFPLVYQLSSIQSLERNSSKNILEKIKRANNLEQLQNQKQQNYKGISGDLMRNLMRDITDLLCIHSNRVEQRISQLQQFLF